MAPDPLKCTLKSFGTFSTPSFGGVGEPFNDGRQRESRTTGQQFTTNSSRKGQIGDNWNRGKYGKRTGVLRLFEGEKFVEMHKVQSKQANDANQKNLTTNGFKYSSKPKHSSGLGNYWGCIGPKHEHMSDFEVLKAGEKPGPVTHELKQVSTSPPKKGYGATTPGVIFGPGPQQGEAGHGRYGGREYPHAVDPYDAARKYETEQHKKGVEAMQGRPAFKTMTHAVDFFDGKPKVASSEIFTENPRIPERAAKEETGGNVSSAPFFPSKAPKSGPQGTFNKFPVYVEDPWDKKVQKAKEEAAANRREGAAPFKPTGNPHTTPCPSIVFQTVGSH